MANPQDNQPRQGDLFGWEAEPVVHAPAPAHATPSPQEPQNGTAPAGACIACDGDAPLTDADTQARLAHIAAWRRNARQAFENWKASQRVDGVEFDAHSIEQYSSMWGRFCSWLEARHLRTEGLSAESPRLDAGQLLEALSSDVIDSFLDSLRGGRLGDRPAAASTRRRYLFLLHRTFTHLAIAGVCRHNPCFGMPGLQRHQAIERPSRTLLRPDQETRFIDWCNAQPLDKWERIRDRALRLLFLASGITVLEARRLRAQDVRIALVPAAPQAHGTAAGAPGGHADVIDALNEPEALVSVVAPGAAPVPLGHAPGDTIATLAIEAHGQVPARVVPVAPFAIPALADWLRTRRAIRAPGDALFNARSSGDDVTMDRARPGSKALCAEVVYDIVAVAMKQSGFEGHRVGPATLRNAFLARQIRANTPLDRIRDWAGLRTTEQLLLLKMQVPLRDDGVRPA